MKNLFYITFILLICSCSKDNNSNVTDLNQELSILVNSIYKLDNTKIVVFEGWISPTSQDIESETKKFYSKLRINGNEAKVRLSKGPYTVAAYNENMRQYLIEKIEIKDIPKVVTFNFNQKENINPKSYSLFSSKDSYLAFGFNSSSHLGVQTNVYVNEVLLNSNLTPQIIKYNYSYKPTKDGFINLKFEYIYNDGTKDHKIFKHYSTDIYSIEELFSNIDEDYIQQDIFDGRSFVSLKSDTIIDNNKYFASKIIKGLYGSYRFGFKNKKIDFIEVIHDNIARNSNYNYIDTKKELDLQFGDISMKNKQQNHIYKLNGFTINLYIKPNSDVVSIITKD